MYLLGGPLYHTTCNLKKIGATVNRLSQDRLRSCIKEIYYRLNILLIL